MNDEQRKEALRKIAQLRMEAKSRLEQYRFMSETLGVDYEKDINRELDLLTHLEKVEQELKK